MGFSWLLFDWGDTVMVDDPRFRGPMATWPEVQAVDGVEACLRTLASGYSLALATNAQDSTREQIEAALRRVGLDQYFQRIFCYQSIGCRKADPTYFELIAEQLGVPRASLVMISDDLEGDVKGAVTAGLTGIWFSAFQPKCSADSSRQGKALKGGGRFSQVEHMSRLPALIEQLDQVLER